MGEELFLQIFRDPLLDDNVVAVELIEIPRQAISNQCFWEDILAVDLDPRSLMVIDLLFLLFFLFLFLFLSLLRQSFVISPLRGQYSSDLSSYPNLSR